MVTPSSSRKRSRLKSRKAQPAKTDASMFLHHSKGHYLMNPGGAGPRTAWNMRADREKRLDLDQTRLTRGQMRKLNALRKSIGGDLGEETFRKWLADQASARQENPSGAPYSGPESGTASNEGRPRRIGRTYETAFTSIMQSLRMDSGMTSELDYVEQISWVLFLKYLHDLEAERRARAELEGKPFVRLIKDEYRWDRWALPIKDGEPDPDARMGDDLIAFVNDKLFEYLGSFRRGGASPQTIEYKIGEVFTELRNKFNSGNILRDVMDIVDGLSFNTQVDRHELSELYETRIRSMGNAGRNGGEYYTPRPLIRAMIRVADPRIGESIYDGACGSAGFLCEAWEYMRKGDLSATDHETLQNATFFGQEKKSLAYVIGIMNMVLHGIEAPNIVRTNTLNENVMNMGECDRHDVVLANPPFGGSERREVQRNFPIQCRETAYLFLQHFIRKLRAGGRGAVVIKNTFLSNTDNASVALRQELLENCDLHTVLDCPGGTFQGAGVKTVVLFFEKGRPTRDIWYYELDPGRSLGRTAPLNDDDLAEFVELQKAFAEGPKSWRVARSDLDEETCDLSVRNPNAPEAAPLRTPGEIIADMQARDVETANILRKIRGML